MFPERTMKPLFHPRALSSLFVALAAVSFMRCAQAGDADAGTGGTTPEEKLLGAPDTYGAGYADPYGRVQEPPTAQRQPQGQGQPDAAAGARQAPADKMMGNANAAQTNAAFVKPGAAVYKPAARVKTQDPAAAKGAAPAPLYGNTGAKASKNKTTEIYRSPY
jgi:hypothetical protein